VAIHGSIDMTTREFEITGRAMSAELDAELDAAA